MGDDIYDDGDDGDDDGGDDDDDELDNDDDYEDNHIIDDKILAVIKSSWSKPMITKFEKASIIGSRAEAIANGAKPFVDVGKMCNPVEMAEKEFNEGLLNFNIVRSIPTHEFTSYIEYIVEPKNLLSSRMPLGN